MIGSSKFRTWLKHPGFNELVSTFLATYGSSIAATTAVISSVKQADAQKDAAKAQRESIAAQKKIADVNTARERVQAARQARMARAAILASAGNEGMGGSGVEGATSSISSQYGGNIANINTMQTFGAQASAANQRAVDAQSSAATWQAIGGLAGGITDWNSIFGGTQSRDNTARNLRISDGKILTVGG